jgi:hypothetical protein
VRSGGVHQAYNALYERHLVFHNIIHRGHALRTLQGLRAVGAGHPRAAGGARTPLDFRWWLKSRRCPSPARCGLWGKMPRKRLLPYGQITGLCRKCRTLSPPPVYKMPHPRPYPGPYQLAHFRFTKKFTKRNATPVFKIAFSQVLAIQDVEGCGEGRLPALVLHWKCRARTH